MSFTFFRNPLIYSLTCFLINYYKMSTTKVTITKVDALGNQLSGVVLEIQDKDGVVIDSWTTSTKDNPRVITGKLILGETYKLVEKSAPAGYTLADPVEFTVSENDIDNKVEMKNTYSASGSLNLTAKKTLTTTETPLTEGQFTFELRDKDGRFRLPDAE